MSTLEQENKEYWLQVNQNLDKQILNEDNLLTYRFFFELGFEAEEDMVTNTSLSNVDKFQALVAVYTAINMVALNEEQYEVCNKIRQAFEKQFNFLISLLENNWQEEDEMLMELTKEYFYTTLQLQAENQ